MAIAWPVIRGQKHPKILKSWPRFAYSLYNFQGATMMIKGSLLRSIPTVKRLRAKIFCPKRALQTEFFGGGG